MTRSVIRLPACPVSEYRPRRGLRRLGVVGLTASLGMLASCTTFGTNIKGSFACGAPEGGSCAPATVIDDKALAEITGDSGYRPAGPFQAPARQAGPQRIAYAAPVPMQAAGVGPQKVLRIVFPAHVDGAGRYHEVSVVQAVVDNGQWLAATGGQGSQLAATQTLNVSPEILSQLGAPIAPPPAVPEEVSALAPVSPPEIAPTVAAKGAPSAAAVAAARVKAREAAAKKAGTPIASATPKATAPELASTSVPANRPAAYSPRVED